MKILRLTLISIGWALLITVVTTVWGLILAFAFEAASFARVFLWQYGLAGWLVNNDLLPGCKNCDLETGINELLYGFVIAVTVYSLAVFGVSYLKRRRDSQLQ